MHRDPHQGVCRRACPRGTVHSRARTGLTLTRWHRRSFKVSKDDWPVYKYFPAGGGEPITGPKLEGEFHTWRPVNTACLPLGFALGLVFAQG